MLSNTMLSNTTRSHTMLSNTMLSNIMLSHTMLSNTMLSHTMLSHTMLSDTMLSNTILSDTTLSDTMLSNTILSDTMLSDSMLSDNMLSDTIASDIMQSHIIMQMKIGDIFILTRPCLCARCTIESHSCSSAYSQEMGKLSSCGSKSTITVYCIWFQDSKVAFFLTPVPAQDIETQQNCCWEFHAFTLGTAPSFSCCASTLDH
jgi:hypothetical protein